jgi:hypothetical protein
MTQKEADSLLPKLNCACDPTAMRARRPRYVQFTVTLNRDQHKALKRLDQSIGAGLTAHVRIALNRYIIAEWAKRRELERAGSRRCTRHANNSVKHGT